MRVNWISGFLSARRRFITIVSLLAVVLVVAVATLAVGLRSKGPSLNVSSCSRGERISLYWPVPFIEFDRELLTEGSDQLAVAGLLELAIRDPDQPSPQPIASMRKLGGEVQLYDRNTLRFFPEEPLPRATPLVLLLSERISEVAGADYQGPYRFEFHTAPFNLTSVTQKAFTRDGRVTIGLDFNDTISPGDLGEKLTLLDGDGEETPYDILTTEAATRFAVQTRRPVEDVVVLLEAGLKGASGPLRMPETLKRKVSLNFQLRLQRVASAASDGFASPDVHLFFNQSIANEEAGRFKDWFSVEPPIEFAASLYKSYRSTGTSRVVLSGPFKAGKNYKVTVLKGLPGKEGYLLNTTASREVYIPGLRPALAFDRAAGFLSPRGHRKLQLSTTNLAKVRVAAQRVHANNLVLYLSHLRHYGSYYARGRGGLFTRKGKWKEFSIDGPDNEVIKSSIDLGQLVDGVAGDSSEVEGVWYVEVENKTNRWLDDDLIVAVTDIALSAMASEDGLLVWATSISGGKPLAGVDISLWTRNNQRLVSARTDEEGLARMNGPFDDRDGEPFVVLGEQAGSLSYLELEEHRVPLVDFPVQGRPYLAQGYDGFVYTDRGVYRPGDSVRVEAIVRDSWIEEPGQFPVQFEILRPDRKRFKILGSMVDEFGSAGVSFKVPESSQTGIYRVALRLSGEEKKELGTVSFQVEDFVPSRMRLSVEVEGVGKGKKSERGSREAEATPARRFHPGESVEVIVGGEYLAGLPARDVAVELGWSLARGAFNPPGAAGVGYVFGDPSAPPLAVTGTFGSAKLDKDGRARFEEKLPALDSDLPLVLSLEAGALDTSGRGVSSRLALDIDPAPFYVGIRKGFEGNLQPGSRASFNCIALKANGEPAALDELDLVFSRVEWSTVMERNAAGRYRYRSKKEIFEIERHTVALSEGRGQLSLDFSEGGAYRVSVRDEPSNRGAAVEFSVYTPGRYGWNGSKRMDKPELLEIEVLSRLLYPGDEARVMIRSPFPGTLLLTTETDRVLSHRVLEMKTDHMEVTVPVPDIPFGNAYLAAAVIRGVDPGQKWRPHRAYGIAPLLIDYSGRQLLVSLQAPSSLRPGDSAAALVKVAGQDGEPLEAQVSLALVDEGILSWTGHATPDPWSFFYGRQRAHAVAHSDLYSSLLPEAGLDTNPAKPGGGSDEMRSHGSRLSPVKGKRFQCTALWLGTFPTDSQGRVLATFDLPDFSGELRIMAIAHSGTHFGSAENYIKVRSPLHLELGLPRFAAPGDRFVSAIDVFNGTGARGIAEIDWDFIGPLEPSTKAVTDLAFASPHTRQIGLESGGSRRLYQGVRALDSIGVAQARIRATLGKEKTEVKVELPVRPAAPLTVKVSSGTVTAASPLELKLGDLAVAGTARHRLCFSPMPDIDLLGSLHYLIRYPHGCLEQTTSKVFPLLYLKDLGELLDIQYGGGRPSISQRGAEIDMYVQRGIQRLLSMLSREGWFTMWPGYGRPWHWGTVYAAHFLVEAQKAGIDVPEQELEQVLDYLAARKDSRGASRMESAYAVYVLALAGREEGLEGRISFLLESDEKETSAGERSLSSEGRFLLGAALSALGQEQKARIVLGEILPEPTDVRQTEGALRSPAREAALMLSTLLDVDPTSPQVVALVTRLHGYKVRGRWGNTQENAYALLALGKYAQQSLAAGSNYTATIRVAEADPFVLEAGENKVIEGDYSGQSINVSLEGDGTLYWFLVEEGVPSDGEVEEVDSGLAVRRRYFDGDGNEIFDGTVSHGDIVQVEVSLRGARRLSNLVITDLLPAGLEVENPRLALSEKTGKKVGEKAKGARSLKVAHMDIRDDRVIFYIPSLDPGSGVYRYAARAVTRGDFKVPVIAAESMYDEGVFSRNGAGRLIVGGAGK